MRAAFVLPLLLLIGAGPARTDPFVALGEAYRTRDAVAAAATYSPSATVIYRYEGAPEERHAGTTAIRQSFRHLFDRVGPGERIDLNFRMIARDDSEGTGLYRLRIGTGVTSYGRFTVTFGPDGRFLSDTSTSATLADFEGAPGPVLIRPDDETIDRTYYTQMAGRYRLPDGCALIVTRSVVRLFLRNSCTGDWRGLNRVSGREWTAGDHVRSDTSRRTISFTGSGLAQRMEIVESDRRTIATREDVYRTEDIAFRSVDGKELRGTVYLPMGGDGQQQRAASVLVHGSGPQDRDGYASIIAVMADELAANGRIVLTYDKRGSGQSGGDGDRAGFDTLADDAIAGIRALAARPDVAPGRIGLAGSSQAGWVAARATQRYPDVADVMLLGAAGSALTVMEQNLYNTEVRMRCAGVARADIDLALRQQQAFFAFLANPAQAPILDTLTRTGRLRPGLANWLFPDSASTNRTGGEWFTVLEPQFDPRPVWRQFKGPKQFLFSQYDDSTPTQVALAGSRADGAQVRLLRGAQHLGLATTSVCRGDVADLQAFSPALFREIADFARLAR
jgi:pimeloyl-ACP methyl ester carboxylesterase